MKGEKVRAGCEWYVWIQLLRGSASVSDDRSYVR